MCINFVAIWGETFYVWCLLFMTFDMPPFAIVTFEMLPFIVVTFEMLPFTFVTLGYVALPLLPL